VVTNSQGTFLYVFGGRQGISMDEMNLNDMYRFDSARGHWESVAYRDGSAPPSPRSYVAMTSIGRTIYVFGGCPGHSRSNELFAFDTETNSWTLMPTNPDISGRGGPVRVLLSLSLFHPRHPRQVLEAAPDGSRLCLTTTQAEQPSTS